MKNQEQPTFDIVPFLIAGAVFFVIALLAVRLLLHLSWPSSIAIAFLFGGVFAGVSYLTRPKSKPRK